MKIFKKLIQTDKYGEITNGTYFRLLVLGITVVLFLISLFISVFSVKTGEVAIITRFGKVERMEKDGLKLKIPFIEEKTIIEVRDNIIQDKYSVSSEDLQTVETEVSMQYKVIDPLNIYKRFKNEYNERLLNPRMSEIIQAVSSNYTIEELVAKRQQLGQEIFKNLKNDLFPFGIEVVKVSIVNHDFSDSFEKAIEQKKEAEQLAQKEEIENQQRIKNAESNLKVKELEAKSNRVITETLTDKILKQKIIEKWDGKLPQVQGDNGAIIDLK